MTDPIGRVHCSILDHVATLTLDRAPVNAFDDALFEGLADHLSTLSHDPGVRVVLLTGAGRTFCAGADLKRMDRRAPAPRIGVNELVRMLAEFPKPTAIAANGPAMGLGGFLCGLVDLVFAAESMRIRCPTASLGINPVAGGSVTFAQRMGPQAAAWFLYTSQTLDAWQCVDKGLAREVLPDEGFLDHVQQRLSRITRNAPNSLQETRRLFQFCWREDLRSAFEREQAALRRTLGSPENREALEAFREGREPDFNAAMDPDG